MDVELPGDAVVIRFSPTSPEGVLSSAEKEHRRTGRFAVSVFAGIAQDGETMDDVIGRLLTASELAGISPERNRKYWLCAQSVELTHLGFKFCKDGDDDELPEHYSVILGEAPGLEEAKTFLVPFGSGVRRP